MEFNMEMRPFTPSPTPPLPMRNPNRHHHSHAHPLPSLPNTPDTVELIPPPLFAKRTRKTMPPSEINITTLFNHPIPPLSPRKNNYPPSPSSIRSSSSTISSLSPPSSPSSRPRALSYSPTPSCWASVIWIPDAVSEPQHSLRRKKSPKRDNLRALRAKESDACLQRVYDQQTSAYLDGSLFVREKLEALGEE